MKYLSRFIYASVSKYNFLSQLENDDEEEINDTNDAIRFDATWSEKIKKA